MTAEEFKERFKREKLRFKELQREGIAARYEKPSFLLRVGRVELWDIPLDCFKLHGRHGDTVEVKHHNVQVFVPCEELNGISLDIYSTGYYKRIKARQC